MRRCASGERIEAASRGHRLIDHDGLRGDDVAEDRTDLVRIECTRRHVWLEGLLYRCILELGAHGICEPIEGIDGVFFRGGEREYGTSFRREHARLVGIAKEGHRCFSTNEDQALHVLQHL